MFNMKLSNTDLFSCVVSTNSPFLCMSRRMTYNCVTDTAVLSLLRYGTTTLVAGAGETLTLDVGVRPDSVPNKYVKIDTGTLVEMTSMEKTIVDVDILAEDALVSTGAALITRVYALQEDLPATPAQDGLLVVIAVTDESGGPGLGLSVNGLWDVFLAFQGG